MAFDAKHKKAVASDAKLATTMEAPPRLELGVADLQSAALPLGYGAILNCTLSLSKKCQLNLIGIKRMERMTRLELATSTLARWRSTG